uniref:ADP-ribosylation factor 1-like 2 n=2 Tax=Plectus sambesii TaxID=2011161 RepID=A0A914W8B8_9BILA
MGSLTSKTISWMWNYFEDSPTVILVLGLKNAGKSTMFSKLKFSIHRDTCDNIPELGFHVERISVCEGVDFIMWDTCALFGFRDLWRRYFSGCAGLIFVVDCCDRQRLGEARNQFFQLLLDEEMAGKPVMILANKKDQPDALSIADIAAFFQLDSFEDRHLHIQATCALSGEGVIDGMLEMARLVKNFEISRVDKR